MIILDAKSKENSLVLSTNIGNFQLNIVQICFYFYFLRHVKVYDTNDYSVVASIDYPSAITSMGLSVS